MESCTVVAITVASLYMGGVIIRKELPVFFISVQC